MIYQKKKKLLHNGSRSSTSIWLLKHLGCQSLFWHSFVCEVSSSVLTYLYKKGKQEKRKCTFTSTPRTPVTHFSTRWANLARHLRNSAHFWDREKERQREKKKGNRQTVWETRVPTLALTKVTLWFGQKLTLRGELKGFCAPCRQSAGCESWNRPSELRGGRAGPSRGQKTPTTTPLYCTRPVRERETVRK